MRHKNSTSLGTFKRRVALGSLAALVGSLLVLAIFPATAHADLATATNSSVLAFIEPTNNAVFSTMDEVPIVLRASALNDVFLSAEVLANNRTIATAVFCCPFCPCARPVEGEETTLQIPVPWKNGMPPPRTWQGWTNIQAGMYRLTARATGENATVVEAAPVNITVLDRTLRIFYRTDGSVTLVIPQGSLITGGYDAEASQDLRTWTRLGPFQPGNVAAFYFDDPPENARERGFYRSVYVGRPP